MKQIDNFKVKLISILFFFLTFNTMAVAQNYSSQKRISLYAIKFSDAKAGMNQFLISKNIKIVKKEEMTERFSAEFILPEKDLVELDALVPTLGYVTENTLNSQDFLLRKKQINESIADELEQQTKLKKELLETGLEVNQKNNLKNLLTNSESNIKRLRQEFRNFEDYDSLAYVVINIYDEITYPTGNRRIAFVNMPGIEYGLLFPENPKAGISNSGYQGVLIKYLFTRGKSYLDLGVYKAINNNRADSTLTNELFLINFGQDFYPRHFGRGKRQYLNLYTCYQVGGFIANQNNDRNNTFNPNLNLGLGVELLKTKYILLDNKVSYFMPLNKLNRNFRSISYNVSFSFVFWFINASNLICF